MTERRILVVTAYVAMVALTLFHAATMLVSLERRRDDSEALCACKAALGAVLDAGQPTKGAPSLR